MPKIYCEDALNSLANEIYELSELVKCPICFGILKSPVELKCKHIFCDQCTQKCLKNNVLTCPVCQCKGNKRSKKQNFESEGLIKFVQNLYSQFKDKFKIDFNTYAREHNIHFRKEVQKDNCKKKSPEVDKFDEVVGNSKKKPEKTYLKSKSTSEEQNKDETIPEETREYVLQWLKDNENVFNRVSQSQHSDVTMSSSKDLSGGDNCNSVSQQKRRRTCSAGQSLRKPLQRRCKSLEFKNKVHLIQKMYSRDSTDMKEMQIEEIDSEPPVKKGKLNAKVAPAVVEKPEKKRKKTSKSSEAQGSSNSSNWDRFKKINKSINKIDSRPKRLKVQCATKTDSKKIEAENETLLNQENISDNIVKGTQKSEYSLFMPPHFRTNVPNENVQSKSSKKCKNSDLVLKLSMNNCPEIEMVCKNGLKPENLQKQDVIMAEIHEPPLDKDENLKKHPSDEKDKAKEQQKQPENKTCTEVDEEDVLIKNTQVLIDANEPQYIIDDCFTFVNNFTLLQERLKFYEKSSNSKLFGLSSLFSTLCAKIERMKQMLENESNFDEFSHEVFTQTDNKSIAERDTQTELVTNDRETNTANKEFQNNYTQTFNNGISVDSKFLQVKPPSDEQETQTSPLHITECRSKSRELETVTTDDVGLDCENVFKTTPTFKTQKHLASEMRLTEILDKLYESDEGNKEKKSIRNSQHNSNSLNLKRPVKEASIETSPKVMNTCRKKLYDESSLRMCKMRTIDLDDTDEDESVNGPLVNKYKRDDVSVCFDTETQGRIDSETVDKYLNDVYDRIEKDLLDPSSEKEIVTQVKKTQMAIKTHTQELLEKCDKLINTAVEKNPLVGGGIVSDTPVKELRRVSTNPLSKRTSGATTMPTDGLFEEDEDIFNNFHTPTASNDKMDVLNVNKFQSSATDDLIKAMESSLINIVEKPSTSKGVTLLQNIVVKNSLIGEEIAENNNIIVDSDEDMILNTPETTPRRDKHVFLAPDRTITPPPDFQDAPQEEDEDEEMISFTPSQNTATVSPIPKIMPNVYAKTPLNRKRSDDGFIQKITSSTPIVKKQLSIKNFVQQQKTTQKSQSFIKPDERKKPVISCTRLTSEQITNIDCLSRKKLATYSNVFSDNVTHMVVCTNEYNCIKDHTIKYISAVAAGIWVVNHKWVLDSLQNNRIMPEETYEALDVTGIEGPKKSRLYRSVRPLLNGFKVHVAPPFVSTTQSDIEKIITLLGGVTVPTPEELLPRENYVCLIITEAKSTQEFDLYEAWIEKLKVVTVDIEWLSRSVGQYKLLSIRRFALCADDSISQFGYPPELLQQVPFSFTQNLTL